MLIARSISLAVAALLALPGVALALEQKLLAGDGAANDIFGTSVAVEGSTAVVGSPGDDGSKGAVYVFTRSGNGWRQTAKLTALDGAGGDNLGSSVAIDGDTIVAGASGDDLGGNASQGSVLTFARTGAAARTETAKLTAADGATGDGLGFSVAIDAGTIVAGAPSDSVGTNVYQGSAYTFARTGAAARTETAKLTALDGAESDFLGFSVAVDGETIVAGAPYDDGANIDEGSAYTFASTGAAERTQTAKLTGADNTAFANDQLGSSVAIDGDTIVAGASGDDLGGNASQGSVLTFARTGAAARNQTTRLFASDGATGDELGVSVAIDGDTIVAGAADDAMGNTTDQGSAYTFARTGAASRTQTAKLTASDGAASDDFGSSVAIDAGAIVAGAPGDTVGPNTSQGSASIFFPVIPGTPPVTTNTPLPVTSPNVINGTPGNDTINGTPGDDVINCGAGNDVVNGGAGNDVINCGAGNDRVSGGSGNDRVSGQSGRDRLRGNSGRDRVSGGSGNDRASGDSGNDRVAGDSGRDRLSGGSGNDRLAGGSGNDRLSGDRGRDRLSGGPGRDRLNGGPGRDRLNGGPGRDRQRQ